VPSATSTATLGSAAIEYPAGLEEGPRRRRYLAAAALGISVAAGVVGAVLIISAAVFRQDDGKKSGVSPSVIDTAAATASPSSSASPSDIDLPADPPASSATADTKDPKEPKENAKPAAATASVAHNDPPRPPTNTGAGTHKPPPTPPTGRPKTPTTTPAPTTTKVDRGF